ncbi:MAG: AAA family ATPase [Gammaproteobacteria bacterium]|nr:AAA family ATPase [Gammaproteobacteria bacterium]MCY4340858.1 AAA family ATPase [Gammaproteobacteria bacterium]
MSYPKIESIRIKGFRSLADIKLEQLPNAAVMIGANGSGKSNFMRFFDLLSWMLRSRKLQEFIHKQGGADDQLFGGSKRTSVIDAGLGMRTESGLNEYRFTLAYAHPDRFVFTDEKYRFSKAGLGTEASWKHLGSSHTEANILEERDTVTTANVIVSLLNNCAVYQFHNTSDFSNFNKRWDADDSNFLRSDGGNLAAVLHRLEQEDIKRYELICNQINRVLPMFDRFAIEESYGKVSLRWKAKWTEKTFGAHLTSDGSLRFFALVTLLNLPPEMLGGVVLLDEPELGLHPAAVNLIGSMVKSVAEERQVIVATQSPLFVDSFSLDEILVLEMREGRTELRQLERDDYRNWLEGDDSFTAGELWQKNLLGGRP